MKNKEKQRSNPFVTGMINMFFDLMKHFIRDFENIRKVKKIDHVTDKFSDMKHMLVRLEDKIQENRRQIDDLKNRVLWGNIIIIILLLISIFNVVR